MTSFWIVLPPAAGVVAVGAVVAGRLRRRLDRRDALVGRRRIVVVAAGAEPEGRGREQRGRCGALGHGQPTLTRSTTKTSVSFGAIGPMPRAP